MTATATEDRLEQSLLGMLGKATGCCLGVAGNESGAALVLPRLCLERCLDGRPENLRQGGCCWLLETLDNEAADRPGPTVCRRGLSVQSVVLPPASGSFRLLVVSQPGRCGGGGGSSVLLPDEEAAAEVTARVLRLCEEQRGMVDEVLHVYEQLHALFAVANALGESSSVRGVYDAIAISLQEHLHADDCCIVTGERWEFEFPGGTDGAAGRLRRSKLELIFEARKSSERVEVLVEQDLAELDEELGERFSSVMTGCIAHGATRCLIGLFRSAGQAPFASGDMCVADSLLRYSATAARNMRLVERLQAVSTQVVRALVSAIEAKDAYTSGHSVRVAELSCQLGGRVGLSRERLQALEWAALLHDVGKIAVPESVLNKPAALSPEEFELVKSHPVHSAKIIAPIQELTGVLEGVLHHHERYDGSGYPDGLAGEGIPLEARLIQVVDVFDALITQRPYRKAFSRQEAAGIMGEEAGTVLDPELVQQFLSMVDLS